MILRRDCTDEAAGGRERSMERIVFDRGEDEIVEKKSRFIGEIVPISSEEEALSYLESVRKKHYNASHHCFAYVLGDKNQLERASDDGEPSGTAGRPILHVLTGEQIRDAIIVVTRYFGGTLLGTGGLTRAYTAAAKAAVDAAKILERRRGLRYRVTLDYTNLGKVQYIAGQMELTTQEVIYAENAQVVILAPEDKGEAFVKKVTDATGGRAQISEAEPVQFGVLDGEVLLL